MTRRTRDIYLWAITLVFALLSGSHAYGEKLFELTTGEKSLYVVKDYIKPFTILHEVHGGMRREWVIEEVRPTATPSLFTGMYVAHTLSRVRWRDYIGTFDAHRLSVRAYWGFAATWVAPQWFEWPGSPWGIGVELPMGLSVLYHYSDHTIDYYGGDPFGDGAHAMTLSDFDVDAGFAPTVVLHRWLSQTMFTRIRASIGFENYNAPFVSVEMSIGWWDRDP